MAHAYFSQVFMALDRLTNAIVGNSADETMSACIYRLWKKNLPAGKILMAPVNFMFRWQGFKNHCERAFYKICAGVYLPPEYGEVSREDALKFLNSGN